MAPSPCILYMLRLWQVTYMPFFATFYTSVIMIKWYILFGLAKKLGIFKMNKNLYCKFWMNYNYDKNIIIHILEGLLRL